MIASAIVLVVLCAVMWMGDKWKAEIAQQVWQCLAFIGSGAFVFTIVVACYYARKVELLKLGACLLMMLLIAASLEHFFHQTANARHVVCPHCSSDDDDTSEDM